MPELMLRKLRNKESSYSKSGVRLDQEIRGKTHMAIIDPITHELLIRDRRQIVPDDGSDYIPVYLDKLNAAARARTKAPYQIRVKLKKPCNIDVELSKRTVSKVKELYSCLT